MYKAVKSTNVLKKRTDILEDMTGGNPIFRKHAKLKLDKTLVAHSRCVSLVLSVWCVDIQLSELWDDDNDDGMEEKTETDIEG